MSLTPQRPFIPQLTPSAARPSAPHSGFHLSPPFVHGERGRSAERLPSISEFLAATPVAVPDVAAGNGLDFTGDVEEERYEIPPIEHFTDPVPSPDLFASDAPGDLADFASPGVATDTSEYAAEGDAQLDESGWEDAGWQHFDWSGAAALGEPPDPEATDAWSRTEWETRSSSIDERETPAQAIASALDQIAHRIRKGELIVPPADLVRDPAAIAATLAALLGVKP